MRQPQPHMGGFILGTPNTESGFLSFPSEPTPQIIATPKTTPTGTAYTGVCFEGTFSWVGSKESQKERHNLLGPNP